MNKYERAFNKIKNEIKDELTYKTRMKDIKTIQELVELRTPKTVKSSRYYGMHDGTYPEKNGYYDVCPNCYVEYIDRNTVYNFCSNCGQALDWSE